MGSYAHVQSAASVLLLLLFVSGCASLSAAAGLKHSSKRVSMLHGRNSRELQSRCGDGPICIPELIINCEVGGDNLGCSCAFLHACRPDVSGCYLHAYGNNITYCGF